VATANEFIEFWLKVSIHADEQYGARRGRPAVQALADRLVAAAEEQGFTREQIEAEIGNIYDFIRASIDQQNENETARLKRDKR
jgi:hypothetical protein